MKKIIFTLMATGVAGLLVSAGAQPAPGDDNTNTPPPADQSAGPSNTDTNAESAAPDAGAQPPMAPDNAPADDNAAPDENKDKDASTITASQKTSPAPGEIPSAFMPPEQAGTNVNDLTLNFTRTPLDMVLNYLSDSAGFVIVQQVHINSSITVTVAGKHLTQDEAANLLNSVLNQNGLAAIRDGRTLTIVDKNDAKTLGIPVKTGNNPAEIPRNAEIVTQIIPIRFVEAQQLVSDLSSFVSPQATVVANEAGNSIVITDTQANIHHIAEIIKAIDDSAEAETEIRVFPLKFASPTDVATELGSIFPSSSSGNTAQAPARFNGGGGPGGFFARMMGGGGGGFGGGAGGGGGGGGNSSADRIKRATQVNAVADQRIQAVIVTAPKDLMNDIAGMMDKLDVPSPRDQDVYTFKLNNGDPQQVAQVLQSMFQGNNSRTASSSSSTTSPLQQRTQNSTQQMSQQGSSTGLGTSSGGGGGGGRPQF